MLTSGRKRVAFFDLLDDAGTCEREIAEVTMNSSWTCMITARSIRTVLMAF